MKRKISLKNISILILTYILGILSSIFCIYIQKIDVLDIYHSLRDENVSQGVYTPDIQIYEAEEVTEPLVTKEIDPCPLLVDVSGAVKNPGVYCLEEGSSVIDGIKKSGGLLQDVGYKYVSMNMNLAKLLTDNSKVYVPYIDDLYCEIVRFELPIKVQEVINPVEDTTEDTQESECVNINGASLEQLQTLTGIGPSTAQKIIDGRPYTSVEGLLNVSGIGQSTLDKFKEQVCI